MRKFVYLLLLLSVFSLYAEPLLKKHNTRPLQAESDLSVLDFWETPIPGFFIRNHHEVPEIFAESFVLVIDGLVEKPLRLSLADIKNFPEKTLHAVLQCSGNGRALQIPHVSGVQWEKGAVGNGEWSGASLADVLARAKVKTSATYARIEGADKPALPKVPVFARSIALNKLLESDTLLAWKMNREPLPLLHGGPLRLILPRWYGQNWLKWVTHITLIDKEDDGFYMKKSYRMPKKPVKPGEKWDSASGDPITELRVQSFMTRPRFGDVLPLKELEVGGKAFSGKGSIKTVVISIDGGKHWANAVVDAPHPDGGWQEFRFKFMPTKVGKIAFLSRSTDAAGNTQPMKADWNPGGYLRNAVDRIEVIFRKNAVEDSRALVVEKCLTCHSTESIYEQSLSAEAWGKVIDKMAGFGLEISRDEKALLADYLSQQKPERVSLTDYGTQSSLYTEIEKLPGDAKKGAELFASHCKECHGDRGQGEIGPRLIGRTVPIGVYWSTVNYGRGRMPAFGSTLERQNIVDIRRFLIESAKIK